MFEIEVVHSADPILQLLCSRAYEIFERPYAGYALFLFGAADEGVASWLARSVVSMDSLTGDDVACIVLAKRIQIHATVTKYRSPRPRRGARRDESGAYDIRTIKRNIETIEQGYSYRPLVEDAESRWNPSSKEIAVTTYVVDHVAERLGVLDKMPCIVFINGGLSDQLELKATESRPIAVLALQDSPGSEVIRFLRAALQQFRSEPGFREYLSSLRAFGKGEERLPDIRPEVDECIRDAEQLEADHLARLRRLEAFKAQISPLIAGASMKGIRKAFALVPELDSSCIPALDAAIGAAKDALTSLNKTIGAIEYYVKCEKWPLSDVSRQRLAHVVQRYVKRWCADVTGGRLPESESECQALLLSLTRIQDEMVAPLLARVPSVDLLIGRTTRTFANARGSLDAKRVALEGELQRLLKVQDKLKSECTTETRPRIVDTVVRQLRALTTDPPAFDKNAAGHHLTLVVMNGGSTGDTYIVGQAGAVGPGAVASDMSFTTRTSKRRPRKR